MVWAKLDDQFPDHPKVAPLSDLAFRVHVAGICYSARHLTDGFVPSGELHRLVRSYKPKAAVDLVEARLWRPTDDGFQIVGFLEYNPSKEKVESEREAAAERKRKWAEKNAVRNASRNGVANGVRNAAPTRPDPSRRDTGRVGGERTAHEPPSLTVGGDLDTSLAPEQVELNVHAITSIRDRLHEGPKAS